MNIENVNKYKNRDKITENFIVKNPLLF